MKPGRHDSRRAIGEALRDCAEPMDARAKAEIRARVLASAGSSPARSSFWSMPQRIAAGVAIATALSGGVAYAASGALPGDFLYPVKRALEVVTLRVLPEGELERRVLVGIAARRAHEAARMHDEGSTEVSADALRELRNALERVSGEGSKLTDDEEVQIRDNAGEQGDAHDVVDDVIGPQNGEGSGTPQPNGSGNGTSESGSPGAEGSVGDDALDPVSGDSPGGTDAGSGTSSGAEQSPERNQ